MKASRPLVTAELSPSASERRKRLGQYFSGLGLGRLLAALARSESAKSIIDPMSGTGDLLAACLAVDAAPDALAGIEIDEPALRASEGRLAHADFFLGSAFDPRVLGQLPTRAWDLVIANPPYVRYQSLSDKSQDGHELPNAHEIRSGLLESLPMLSALDAEDRRLFAHLVNGYSGLSDLAVPSWILCAALVRTGGRLALVVPEAWLSRDYATIVRYLLFRWFEIEFIVEDEHATWFDDAQVKTTLIIARRVERRESALSFRAGAAYCHIGLSGSASDGESPIGRMALPRGRPEREFARQAREWLRDFSKHVDEHVNARPVSMQLACANMMNASSKQKWFASMGERGDRHAQDLFIPHAIHHWLESLPRPPTFQTFAECGIGVGQGLRTGANDFFYADGQNVDGTVSLAFGGPLSGLRAEAPSSIARPALRKQSELPDGYVFKASESRGWALDLRRHVLPEDLGRGNLISAVCEPMPAGLADAVRFAAEANFGTAAKPRRVWQLTAVAPNIRFATGGLPQRHWYMLPDFAPRHLPDVLLARVNAGTPKAYLNENRASLIDANFSSMWLLPASKWSSLALLAYMNGAWAQALIECSGAVMGGGALKVEAAHLRRLPLPELTENALHSLHEFGAMLCALPPGMVGAEILTRIDEVVATALGSDARGIDELRRLVHIGQEKRTGHKQKR